MLKLWICLALTFCLMLTTAASAEPFSSQGWTKSPAYAEASAHDPRYDDRTLWPAWVEQTAFAKEKWPAARVLVWKHVGKRIRGKIDLSDPENWLENGQPATRGPDRETDIIFPSSETRYSVADGKGCDCRHLTVGSGVSAFLKSISVYGNAWIKDGGSWHQVNVRGSRDTFMRNDAKESNLAANKIAFNKPADKSVEWIGDWKLGDELDLFSGNFIIAPDSTFMPGDRSTQHIYPDGTLTLHSGSAFYKRGNQYWGDDLAVTGKIFAGTPERPLTRDATIGLSFKDKGNGAAASSQKGDLGVVVYKSGLIAVHSTDPTKARLIFNWHRRPCESGGPKGGEPAAVAAMDHGIDMLILGTVRFDGVEFRDVLKSGIKLPDLSVRDQWKNVTFGTGNFAEGDALFQKYDGPLDIKMKNDGVAKELAEGKEDREKHR